ncbi:MAG: cobalamin-binding protein [Pseudomonadota bacterium]|nr:cobalamin-binding protein [Pseudomonadota bacterium]
MKWFKPSLPLTLLLALASGLLQAAPISLIDDGQRQVVLPAPAQRIVSLAPHITEVLFAAGAGDRIVGTVNYSDYPEAAKAIPQVGGYNQVNFERILSLNPDLIIGWYEGNSAETVEKLKLLQIPVYMSDPKTMDSISHNIRQFGMLTATASIANRAAQEYDRRRAELKQANADKPPIRVFYQVWEDPLYTLAGGHFISDLYRLCGGVNVFADLSEASPIVSVEAIVIRNPQVMLTGGHHGKRSIDNWKGKWATWGSMDAVKHGMLFFVDQDMYTRSTPRTVDAAENLCEILDQARGVYYPGKQE